MSIVEKDSSGARGLLRAILPERLTGAPDETAGGRRSRRSMVSRSPESVIWFRRVVLKRKPRLHHFEVQLTDHCNLDCKGCSHFSNLCPPNLADLGEFEADMKHMANLFPRVHQIYLTGGEPLLHPQVAEFCAAARSAFPKSHIYLKTNGALLLQMSDEFWNVLAKNKISLLCSPFPIGVSALEINLLAGQRGVKIAWTRLEHELVKIPIDPRGGFDAATSFKQCQGYNNRPILRNGRLYPCAYIAYAGVFKEHFGLSGLQVYPTDSIGIRDEHTPEEVFEFLRNPVHWCSNCDMDNRESFEWAESSHHISEWTSAPPAPNRPAPPSANAR